MKSAMKTSEKFIIYYQIFQLIASIFKTKSKLIIF
jgi:hypothetical protein